MTSKTKKSTLRRIKRMIPLIKRNTDKLLENVDCELDGNKIIFTKPQFNQFISKFTNTILETVKDVFK